MAVVETDHIANLPATSVDRVGLLGGSFNPAHDGHRHISLEAHKRLQLDEVWWLVSPQNPLKNTDDMAPLETRLETARHVARSSRIRVSDIESNLGTSYTAESVVALKSRFAATRFVWLMGADNLLQLPMWRDWKTLFQSVPIAVFTRSSYSRKALAGVAAQRFAKFRLPERAAAELIGRSPPVWVFLHTSPHPASATKIRQRGARKETCHAN